MARPKASGWLLLVALLTACSGVIAQPPPPSGPAQQKSILLPGRVLVLPVPSEEPNRPMVEAVARLMARAFHDRWGNVVPYETYLRVAQGALTAPWDLGLRLSLTQGRDHAESRWLIDHLGIQTVVLVEVYDLEQRWTRSGKATRVGVDARALHLPSSELLWRARYRPEIEGRPGRAVSTSVELAVHQLVLAIHGETEGAIASQWWLWKR